MKSFYQLPMVFVFLSSAFCFEALASGPRRPSAADESAGPSSSSRSSAPVDSADASASEQNHFRGLTNLQLFAAYCRDEKADQRRRAGLQEEPQSNAFQDATGELLRRVGNGTFGRHLLHRLTTDQLGTLLRQDYQQNPAANGQYPSPAREALNAELLRRAHAPGGSANP